MFTNEPETIAARLSRLFGVSADVNWNRVVSWPGSCTFR